MAFMIARFKDSGSDGSSEMGGTGICSRCADIIE
jgi:hypothetical protein